MDVKVTVRPALKLDMQLAKSSICEGDSSQLNLNLSGGIPSQYTWSLNGIRQSDTNIFVSPGTSTPYTIKFYDNCSWDVDTSFNITVNPLPVLDFVADDTLVCTTNEVNFTNKSSGASAFEWTFSPTGKSKATSTSYRYNAAGVYDVSLKASSAQGCSNQLTRNAYIRVIELPKSDFSYTAVSVTYDHPLVTFNNQSSHFSSFKWDFGDGTTETVATDPSHMFSDTGRFYVSLVSTNSIGCADTATYLITVRDIYKLFIPTAISVNGDGHNEELKIGGRGILAYKLRIFNRWGEMVYTGTEKDKAFNGKDSKDKDLPKGSYVLVAEIRDHEGKMHYLRQVLQVL